MTNVNAVPTWFKKMLPERIERDALLMNLFWQAHQLAEVRIDEDEEESRKLGTKFLDVASSFALDFALKHPDAFRNDMIKHADVLPEKASSLIVVLAAYLLNVHKPFLVPLIEEGLESYVRMYARKLGGRLMRGSGLLDVDCSCLIHECSGSTYDLVAHLDRVRHETPAVRFKEKKDVLVFEPPPAFFKNNSADSGVFFKDAWEACEEIAPKWFPLKHILGPRTIDGETVHVVTCGGFAAALVMLMDQGHISNVDDIDLYIVGAKSRDVFLKATDQVVKEAAVAMANKMRVCNEDYRDMLLNLEGKEGSSDPESCDVPCVFSVSSQAVTVSVGHGPGARFIQVSTRMVPSVGDVFLSYDLDCCCAAFDGERILLSEGCSNAMAHMATTIDPWQHTRVERIAKYADKKGFRMTVPVAVDSDPCLSYLTTSFAEDHAENLRDNTRLSPFPLVCSLLRDPSWNVAQLIALHYYVREVGFKEHALRSMSAGNTRLDPSCTRSGLMGVIRRYNKNDASGIVTTQALAFKEYLFRYLRGTKTEVFKLMFSKSLVSPDLRVFGCDLRKYVIQKPLDRSYYSEGSKMHFYELSPRAARAANQNVIMALERERNTRKHLEDDLRQWRLKQKKASTVVTMMKSVVVVAVIVASKKILSAVSAYLEEDCSKFPKYCKQYIDFLTGRH